MFQASFLYEDQFGKRKLWMVRSKPFTVNFFKMLKQY